MSTLIEMRMYNSSDISVVLQGMYYPGVTERSLASVRENLPGAQIIFSTCDREGAKRLAGYDRLIVSEDPGSFACEDHPSEKENNINRQIVNTLAALREVVTPYVFKLRTDFILAGHDFLEYFDRYPKAEEAYRVFSHKILSCCYFARNPRSDVPYPLHPSDLAFFGRMEDVLKLFDIPLMTEEQAYWNPRNAHQYRYAPEQYIFISCLHKNRHPFDCQYYNDCRPVNIEQTERYFASNFIFLDFHQFNLKHCKNHFAMNVHPNAFRGCYTHVEWMRLYKAHVDPQLEVPQRDEEREKIEVLYSHWRRYHWIANICALPLRSRTLRRRVRNRILEYFLGDAHDRNKRNT